MGMERKARLLRRWLKVPTRGRTLVWGAKKLRGKQGNPMLVSEVESRRQYQLAKKNIRGVPIKKLIADARRKS